MPYEQDHFKEDGVYLLGSVSGDSTKIEFGSYPAGEMYTKTWAKDEPFWYNLLVKSTNPMDLMYALWYADACKERTMRISKITLPYLPGARQDRINPSGDFLFTSKSLAREINLRDFYEVVTFDPHSHVMPGLIDNCKALMPDDFDTLCNVVNNGGSWDCVVIPDAGASHRAVALAAKLGLPTIQAWKKRDVTSGKLTGFGIEPTIADFNRPLIVDDICDGGGTFIGLAQTIREIKKNFCVIALYTSFGIYSKGFGDLLKSIDVLYTTDCIAQTHPNAQNAIDENKLVVVPTVHELV